jgi:hypothetical protein
MIRKAAAACLVSALALSTSACGYQGWVRYECQEWEFWNEPQCQKPQCVPTGTCTEDIIGKVYSKDGSRRSTPEDVHAQLILIIGSTLAAVFLIVTLGITYALIFVTQPIGNQAPNDAAFIDLLKHWQFS